jgi:alkylhydroperoxidase/carboxymuconolactone decarboxylase family protein YurZ
MAVRRAVLGDKHVDRAVVRTDDTTRDFQDFINRVAWGDTWSRPGLDRRTRSCLTLAALMALNHPDELAMHPGRPALSGVEPGSLSRFRRRGVGGTPATG